MKSEATIFENHSIRRVYDEDAEIWWFAVVDIVQVLTQQPERILICLKMFNEKNCFVKNPYINQEIVFHMKIMGKKANRQKLFVA